MGGFSFGVMKFEEQQSVVQFKYSVRVFDFNRELIMK
jgi:hypothetical protein